MNLFVLIFDLKSVVLELCLGVLFIVSRLRKKRISMSKIIFLELYLGPIVLT